MCDDSASVTSPRATQSLFQGGSMRGGGHVRRGGRVGREVLLISKLSCNVGERCDLYKLSFFKDALFKTTQFKIAQFRIADPSTSVSGRHFAWMRRGVRLVERYRGRMSARCWVEVRTTEASGGKYHLNLSVEF